VEEPITNGTGAATGEVVRVTGELELSDGRTQHFRLVRKTVGPVLTSGPHAQTATKPDHWAYWRREPLAYGAGLLPRGPGLTAPRCFGVEGDTVYLEDVQGGRETAQRAAYNLGRWHASAGEPPDYAWLAGHQLQQRVEVSDLDWTTVDADPRAELLWDARWDLLDALRNVPHVLSHGDYHLENLLARSEETVALDWSTVGRSPVGADCAHLALSTLAEEVLDVYLDALGGHYPLDAATLGYRATLVLVGASRVHWMLRTGVPVPDGYVDLIWNHRPASLR